MRIALDYDDTYTRDPEMWDRAIAVFRRGGHKVVCVTMRYDKPGEHVQMPCEVYYTGRKGKMQFMADQGVNIDVWIDDQPHFIVGDASA